MTEKEKKTLCYAVKAIYFDDSSDFSNYLWKIIGEIGGEEATNLLFKSSQAAYDKYCKGD
jgi:hypothetical protein